MLVTSLFSTPTQTSSGRLGVGTAVLLQIYWGVKVSTKWRKYKRKCALIYIRACLYVASFPGHAVGGEWPEDEANLYAFSLVLSPQFSLPIAS